MVFKTKTLEGDNIVIQEVVGCNHYDIPLKETVGSFFCKHTNSHTPIHAIERFEMYPEVAVHNDGLICEPVYTYTKKLRSIGLTERTRQLKLKKNQSAQV
jgi:hypothetical protein